MKKIRLISIVLLTMILAVSFIGCAKEEAAPAAAAPAAAPAAKVEAAPAAAEPAPAPEADPVEEAAMAYFNPKADDNNMIAQDAFLEKVKAGEDLVIVDIRQPDVYAEGHVKGAVNVPWNATDIPAAMSQLPTDVPVYVYCYTGQTAGQTVALLNVAGIQAKSVRYGYTLGISKVEGYEEAIETTPNFLDDLGTKIDPAIEAAIVDYYATLAADPNTKNNIISSAAAKEMLDASEGEIVVVSIRQADAYASGHIEGAINIPWGTGMQESFAQLPKDQQLFVYCYSGQTAGQTVAIMKLLGYDAASIKSGMGTPASVNGWANEGFPVVQ